MIRTIPQIASDRALTIACALQVIQHNLHRDSAADHQRRVQELLRTVQSWKGVALRLDARGGTMSGHGISVTGTQGPVALLRAWTDAVAAGLRAAEAQA